MTTIIWYYECAQAWVSHPETYSARVQVVYRAQLMSTLTGAPRPAAILDLAAILEMGFSPCSHHMVCDSHSPAHSPYMVRDTRNLTSNLITWYVTLEMLSPSHHLSAPCSCHMRHDIRYPNPHFGSQFNCHVVPELLLHLMVRDTTHCMDCDTRRTNHQASKPAAQAAQPVLGYMAQAQAIRPQVTMLAAILTTMLVSEYPVPSHGVSHHPSHCLWHLKGPLSGSRAHHFCCMACPRQHGTGRV